jgi:hypothetical protein
MMESDTINRILADIDTMRKRGAASFRDCAAGQELHAAADELSAAYCLIARAASRFGISEHWLAIRQAGRDARLCGISWFNNPHAAGSWQAWQWDLGQQDIAKAESGL